MCHSLARIQLGIFGTNEYCCQQYFRSHILFGNVDDHRKQIVLGHINSIGNYLGLPHSHYRKKEVLVRKTGEWNLNTTIGICKSSIGIQ